MDVPPSTDASHVALLPATEQAAQVKNRCEAGPRAPWSTSCTVSAKPPVARTTGIAP